MPAGTASITGRERGAFLVALAIAGALGAVFWLPAIGVGRGWFPAPLDDVYIHFDFARSFAQGHPFEWIPGQGYSSGETAPLYAVVLAIGWLVGFRGRALGLWAAIVALLSVASLVQSTRRLARPAPRWLAWLVALLPISIGVVDWALFSGMEVALFVAVLARALEALAWLRRADRGGPTRERRQWHVGAWGAALALLRPEAAILVAVLALFGARGVGRRSAIAALGRMSAPGAIATVAVLGANFVATGDPRSAGAQLKLLSSNPYLSDVDRARVFVENLVTFWVKVVRAELAITPAFVAVLPALAIAALVRREHRTMAGACLACAIGWILLVSWNGNAPYHNFRYYAPALALLAIGAALGVATIASMVGARFGAALGAIVIVIVATKVPGQVKHFRTASANIRDQHIEVAERLAALPANATILLNDAGVIPYVSGRPAVDAMGLGGYHRVPFAHAAVYGEAATIELIERMDPKERPTHFALYPNWFGTLTSRFGVELDHVTIADNIICAGATKGIYRADWSTLDVPRARAASIVDEIDVGDVVDEAAHGYTPPLPHGGWSTLDVLDEPSGARRFDGGRTIPDGMAESFVVARGASGAIVLRVRLDAGARGVVVSTSRITKELAIEPPRAGSWRHGVVTLDTIEAGEAIQLRASGGEYRDYHVWLERPAAAEVR